jgi:hypothetical protein
MQEQKEFRQTQSSTQKAFDAGPITPGKAVLIAAKDVSHFKRSERTEVARGAHMYESYGEHRSGKIGPRSSLGWLQRGALATLGWSE